MDRVDDPTKATDLFGSGKHGYTEGAPGLVDPTRVRDTALNSFQEEIIRTIEGAGLSPDADDLGQLNAAIKLHFRMFALQNWEIAPMTDEGFLAIAYGQGKFVAVGQNGSIITSTDGFKWAAQTADNGYTGIFRTVGYSPDLDLWVAAGESGEIQTSPDGETWTEQTAGSGYTGDFRGSTWANNQFVLVGDDDGTNTCVQLSADGSTWSKVNVDAGAKTLAGVAYHDGLIVAVGEEIGGAARVIYTSSDGGINWTSRMSAIGNPLCSVLYASGPAKWIAVGENGAIYASNDAITWEVQTGPHGTQADYYAIDYIEAEGLSVAVEYNSASDVPGIIVSRDAISWTAIPIYGTDSTLLIRAIANGTRRSVVVGTASGTSDLVMRSHAFGA